MNKGERFLGSRGYDLSGIGDSAFQMGSIDPLGTYMVKSAPREQLQTRHQGRLESVVSRVGHGAGNVVKGLSRLHR